MIKFILRLIACILLIFMIILIILGYILSNYILGIRFNCDMLEYLDQAICEDIWIDYKN